MGQKIKVQESEKTLDMKQTFLANAIADISAYIQLADTKVSIVMGAVVAILVGITSCYELIGCAVENIIPCSWGGVLLIILVVLGILSAILTFVFGILTVRGHSCIIDYKSKWFWAKSTKEYSFVDFARDIQKMSDNDIIINMAAELYKLNDINRKKMRTMRWTLCTFSALLIVIAAISVFLLVKTI